MFIFFLRCFHGFPGNAPLKSCFDFLYKKNLFPFILLVCKKNVFNFDESKSFLINSVQIVLFVRNHIEMLLLNNQLFNKRDTINIFDATF